MNNTTTTPAVSNENLQSKTIEQLARIVKNDWEKVSPYAIPYLSAMEHLTSIKDPFGADSGVSVVAYFLSNAMQWKGEVAKAVKKELNRRMKEVYKNR